MRPCRYAGNVGTRRIGVAILCGMLFGASAAADRLPADPAEEVIQTLKSVPPDVAKLERQLATLQRLGDLRRVLAADWPVEALKLRAQLGERFLKVARTTLRSGDAPSRLAVITMIGEAGVSLTHVVTGSDPPVFVVLSHTFTEDLIEIAKRGESPLREAAARALGKIAADPKTTAAALGQLLTDPSASIRLAAADGLVNMQQVLVQVAPTISREVLSATPATLARVASVVVPEAAKGLADSDTAIRRRCMEAIYQGATVLMRGISPRGTAIPITPATVAGERQTLAPLSQALVDSANALARALRDTDPDVRRLAGRTFENMGLARELLQRPLSPMPMPPQEGRRTPESGLEVPVLSQRESSDVQLAALRRALAQAAGEDLLLPGLRTALRALTEAVSDPDDRVRLAVIDVLESLGPEAASAVPALTRALSDRNRFVRWSAARTLGKIGPVEGSATAVSGMVPLLEDDDLDVRLAVCLALERLGPVARGAVPALIQSVAASDATLRSAAIRALVGIGRDSVPAVPALGSALSDPDARVRRTAAEALGRFGPAARAAAGLLMHALDDPDPDVRKAASDALLSLQDAGK